MLGKSKRDQEYTTNRVVPKAVGINAGGAVPRLRFLDIYM